MNYLILGIIGFFVLLLFRGRSWLENYIIPLIIYQPPAFSWDTNQHLLDILHNDPQIQIAALQLLLKPRTFQRTAIVFFHGNACDVAQMEPELRRWQRQLQVRGLLCDVYAPEYPTYGLMQILYPNVSRDETLAILQQFVRTIQHRHERLIFIGQSLGTHFATATAAGCNCDQLVLISPFRNLQSIVGQWWSWARFLPGFKVFNTDDYLRAITPSIPLIIWHGVRDDVVHSQQGQELFELAPNVNKKIFLQNSGHNDMMFEPIINSIHVS